MTFSDLVGGMDEALLRALGTVTYTTRLGVSSTIRGILETGIEAEEKAPGVYAALFVRSASFVSPPQRGEEITIGTALYKIVDINADGEGGLRLLLRFDREVIS